MTIKPQGKANLVTATHIHSTGLPDADYRVLRDRIFDAIWSELDPLEQWIEDEETIPLEIVLPILDRIGAFGLLIPREYGGSGLSIAQYLPIIAEFAKVQGGLRVIVHVHNSFAHALSEIGNDEQRAAVLPGAVSGRNSVAFALTEPGHGTGADLGSTAVREADEYIITGQKWLITNSDIASHFIVFAKTTATEVSAFLVPRDTAGLAIEPLPETMGCKGGEHGRLTLSSVRVPDSALSAPRARAASTSNVRLRSVAFSSPPVHWARPSALSSCRSPTRGKESRSARRSALVRQSSATWPRWRPTSMPFAASSPTPDGNGTPGNAFPPKRACASCSVSRPWVV